MNNPQPCDVARFLIHQVSRAAAHETEQSVVTLITRPMWDLFCQFTGDHGEPTAWLGIKETRRVYGSKTIIIPGDNLLAISFKP